ncbi:DNA polymerase epsilon subunit, putative, partial [Eimeria tenella]
MAPDDIPADAQDPSGLFDDEDTCMQLEEPLQQQQQQQQEQQQQEQQQSVEDSLFSAYSYSAAAAAETAEDLEGLSFSPSPATAAAAAPAAAAAAADSAPAPAASAACSQAQQQQQLLQQEEQQQQQEEAVDRSAVLLQCGSCACHLLVFEELEERQLAASFDLLHLIVLAATRPLPQWQQQQQQQQGLLQQQHGELLQPMMYSWGFEEPQPVKLNLSLLRFTLDCMQSVEAAGVGCSRRSAFLSSYLAFCRLRRQQRRAAMRLKAAAAAAAASSSSSSKCVFVLHAFKDFPGFAFDESKE